MSENNKELISKPAVQMLQHAENNVDPVVYDTLIKKWWPSEEKRAIIKNRLALIETKNSHLEQAFKMHMEAQIHELRERYNEYLVAGKVSIRADRARYIEEQKASLENHIQNQASKFYNSIDKEFNKLQSYENKIVRDKAEKRLVESIESYDRMISKLLDEFEAILDENIKLNN